MENTMTIALSIIFFMTPILLVVHLAIKQNESRKYKKRLGYIYGGLWAIAWLGYGWLFLMH
jgi:hypothetical protein